MNLEYASHDNCIQDVFEIILTFFIALQTNKNVDFYRLRRFSREMIWIKMGNSQSRSTKKLKIQNLSN